MQRDLPAEQPRFVHQKSQHRLWRQWALLESHVGIALKRTFFPGRCGANGFSQNAKSLPESFLKR